QSFHKEARKPGKEFSFIVRASCRSCIHDLLLKIACSVPPSLVCCQKYWLSVLIGGNFPGLLRSSPGKNRRSEIDRVLVRMTPSRSVILAGLVVPARTAARADGAPCRVRRARMCKTGSQPCRTPSNRQSTASARLCPRYGKARQDRPPRCLRLGPLRAAS